MNFTEAKNFVKELNDRRYWCGGTTIWDIFSASFEKRKPKHLRRYHAYVLTDHINAKHWELNILRWRVSICRQFLKFHITRLDDGQTHTKPASKPVTQKR